MILRKSSDYFPKPVNLRIVEDSNKLFNRLQPSDFYMYRLFEHNITTHDAHRAFPCVPYGSHNKQRLFP
jgi:hypothetical protein